MNTRYFARVLGAVAVAVTIAFTMPAIAGKGHGRGGDRGAKIEKLAEKLNLTADQKARIKTIREQFQQANAGTIQEMKTLRDQAKQQMQSGNKEGAQATREQIKAKGETLKAAREQMMEQIKAVLTPEQRAQAEQLMQQHKGKGKKEGRGKGQRGQGAQGQGNSDLR